MRKEARTLSRTTARPGEVAMPVISFARLEAELLRLYGPAHRRKGTHDKIRQVLREVRELGCVKKTSDLKPPAIAAWLEAHEGERGPATKLSLLRTFRTICRYAETFDYVRRDPFRWRPPQKWIEDELDGFEPIDRHITAIAAMRLCSRADQEALDGDWKRKRLRALVYLLTYTGVRKNEALGLQLRDLDFEERTFWIRPNERRKLKTRKSKQRLALALPLVRVLKPWSRETGSEWLFPGVRRLGPWIDGASGYRALDEVQALGERAGVEGLTILSFRHTIGTLAEPAGITELELQRWFRHTNPGMQRGYRHEDVLNLRTTANKIARGYKDALIGVPRELLAPSKAM